MKGIMSIAGKTDIPWTDHQEPKVEMDKEDNTSRYIQVY